MDRKNIYIVLDVTFFLLFMTLTLLILTGNLVIAVVEGISMEPLFQTGDVVFVIKVKPSDIKPGDIIVYEKPNGAYIIHRVTKIVNENSEIVIITKGDNNKYYDPPISVNQVVGKVLSIYDIPVKLPFLGLISLWIKSILNY
ncbi:MAG: signal peptidase I [Desulfurococcales archaeon ex4484_42]|nr:MAG: signal peptidase I [Desulfurococcales archaeon ex4484_42]